jgi:uroporphyrinogen-III synthase
MPPRTLYLGIDAPSGVFHYPVIRTERIDSPKLFEALALAPRCSHVIFTSKNGVRHWPAPLSGKTAIAIGDATASEIVFRGCSSLIAPDATQEGVAALLDRLDLKEALILYPHSKRARPFLTGYLKSKKIRHFSFALYDTVFQRLEPPPDLADFDEIVFTSPSTVVAFLQIYSALPRGVALTPIGPITKKALDEYMISSL